MPLILLDARGQVIGRVDPLLPGPPWLQGLQAGASLPRHLQGLSHQGAGVDIDALQLGLAAVLEGHQPHFEHRQAHAGWCVHVQACTDALPVAAVLSVEACGDERLRARLTAAERRLAAVQQVAGLGSWYVDAHSGRVQWSRETYLVLGVDPSSGPLNSATVRSRVHPEDLPRLLADRARVRAGEPLVTSHFRFRRDDGRECWLESRVTLEPATDELPAGIVGTVRDVSESTRAQLALRPHRDPPEDLVVSPTVRLAAASERVESVARRKSALLAHTSHEIRTPLNVIVSLSHLMRCSLTDATQQGRAQAVEHAARHLSDIIDDVLAVAHDDLSAPGAGRQPLDPAALLAEVAAMLGEQAQARGLQLEVVTPPALAAGTVRGDVARLRQALLNAAGWTLARAGGGRVRLLAQLGPVQGVQRTLRLVVESDALAPRADDTADPDPQWAALQRLARQLAAQVQLEGGGAGGGRCVLGLEVVVDVGPAAPAPIVAVESSESAEPADAAARIRLRHRGRRVLLAEDDDINQMAMQELLADVGLDVDTASDGHEAVDQASRRAYALILLDLRMPRLDGVGAARTIRALPEHHATPMVAITANAFDEDRQACRAAGMNDFMAKPVEVRRLYEVLLHWLDRGSAAPAGAADPVPTPAPVPAGTPPPAPAAAAMPGSDPMQPLLGLEGVDALSGLASVGGRPAVYRRLLRVFIETHAGDGAHLTRLLQAGDAAAAGSLAHRLRGSAATLGLIDIEVAAAALEGAIDNPTPDAPLGLLSQAVTQSLQGTLDRLRQALAA